MRRIKVSSSSTKGKNERMAFAATENAKVCTSVRITYFTVEDSRLGKFFVPLLEAAAAVFTGMPEVADELGSIKSLPILSESCR